MTFRATVIKLMIASPSDVARERQLIRDVVHEWNSIHASDRKTLLLPVGWETDASPKMGERPQSNINEQILSDCDLLVAVFWTRLGTATGESASGTVEEINKHVDADKPAMLYFSDVPVQLGSVDSAQYDSLVKFKGECFSRGLVEGYETLASFRETFSRQLAQTVIRSFGDAIGQEDDTVVERTVADAINSAAGDAARIALQLSPIGRSLIEEASADSDGMILCVKTMSGLTVQVNGKALIESADRRTEAEWEAAIDQLTGLELIQDQGTEGEVFALTKAGYSVSDHLLGAISRRAGSERQGTELNDMQAEYLMTISKPRNNGSILGFIDQRKGREIAPYQDALQLFQDIGLIRYTGSSYDLTPDGWNLADQQWALDILDELEVEKYSSDRDLATEVGLTDGQIELDEVHRHIAELSRKGFVRSTRTSSGVGVALTQEGATQRKRRQVDL